MHGGWLAAERSEAPDALEQRFALATTPTIPDYSWATGYGCSVPLLREKQCP